MSVSSSLDWFIVLAVVGVYLCGGHGAVISGISMNLLGCPLNKVAGRD